ncbi:MAG: hypothetical protein ABIJ12_06065 [bacterium]
MKSIRVIMVVLSVLFLLSMRTAAQESTNNKTAYSVLNSAYFGQKPPGEKAEVFAPNILTIEPHDAPVILKDEELFIIGTMAEGIIFYKMSKGKLLKTNNPFGFDIPTICQGITVSPSKNRLYIRDWNNGKPFFYSIDKKDSGWTSPKSLGEDVNSIDTHWQFTVSNNENLYFFSRGVGIVVSVFDGNTYLKPLPVKLEDNSILEAETPYISPDESYLIFCKDDDLQISYKLNNGKWTIPQNLGTDINSDRLDICPQISPNGKYLFFVSKRTGPDFVTYWVNTSFIEKLRLK